MKMKHAVIMGVLGLCFDFIGALFKMMHFSYSDTLLIIGTVLKVSGGLLFLYKLLTHPKAKEILNW